MTGLSRTALFAHPETALSREIIGQLDALLERRCQGEPIAYITGLREFWSLEMNVSPSVLIPRPDTELLVETALAHLSGIPVGAVADLGTGCGAIAIALALELPERHIIAIERSAAALHVAAGNLKKHAAGNVSLLMASWLMALRESSLAMAVANPPYLQDDDNHLASLSYEPAQALISGADGLQDITDIVTQFKRTGMPGALLLLEHGHLQGAMVRELLRLHGYNSINTSLDLAGLERVSHATLPKS